MEDEHGHIEHEGFTLPLSYRQKWVRRHRWVTLAVFAAVALLLNIPPFFCCIPIIALLMTCSPQCAIRFINWIVGKWHTSTIVSVYNNHFTLCVIILMLGTSRDHPSGNATVFKIFFDVNVRLFGDTFDHFDDRSLMLMNHRTHLDWLFLWSVVGCYGNLDSWKPITKSSLKHIPIYGWGMQFALHIFVNRNWTEDEQELHNKLQLYNMFDMPVQVLLFPGGGDLTLKTKTSSDKYADQRGFPHYNYVLHPHLTGFLYVVNLLRNRRLDSIIDITVAYPDALPKTELHFIKGHIPREVHYYVKVYPLSSIPGGDDNLSDWIREVWAEKEERLKYFYANRQFPDKEYCAERHVKLPGVYQAFLLWIIIDLFLGLMFYYFFYFTIIYFIVGIGWAGYRITSEGSIDKWFLSDVYNRNRADNFDYKPPAHLL